MRTFADNAGRTWTLSLSFGAVKRVRGLLDVNLLELDKGEPPLLTRLGTDPILLVDVIFAVIKPQADGLGVTDEQWAESMGGEAMLAAQKAFYEEVADFTRSQGRPDMAKAALAQHALLERVIAMSEERIGQIDVEELANKISGDSSTSLPGSSD